MKKTSFYADGRERGKTVLFREREKTGNREKNKQDKMGINRIQLNNYPV